ncbi:DUF6078 family protein [Bacteroides sp.]|uniref:DUF6078 family protein n=1 Tax=Bacteroides sp. TaxID=29523 RepID=UPI0026034782|nr:DUF6078 family protein [Bacteroides sp.]
MKSFDYSQVPYGFGVCASSDCSKASTCLRHIALEHAPLKYSFLPTLTPQKLEAMKGNCEYYCPETTVRYAKGFTRAMELLTVRDYGTFRSRLMSYFGRKNYYLARRGEWLIRPVDQEYIIRLAKSYGVELDDYFDDYVDGYDWNI